MRPTKNSKIIFFGTPEISAQVLRSLLDAGYEISAIVTNPDAPVGRHHVMTPSPVKVLAQERGIPVLTPEKLDSEFYALLTTNYKLHLGIVVAYGKIIPQNIIDSFPLGMLNIHYSLLPKYRGASPVENAILAGDATTGVTIQKLVFKLDAGPIVAVREFEIDNEITSPELKIKLTEVGSELLLETLPHCRKIFFRISMKNLKF
jgi:methionyl-tRNA formyltransferase